MRVYQFRHLGSNKTRAENGTRTRDPDLGKVVLYQLSYFRIATGVPLNAVQKYNIILFRQKK